MLGAAFNAMLAEQRPKSRHLIFISFTCVDQLNEPLACRGAAEDEGIGFRWASTDDTGRICGSGCNFVDARGIRDRQALRAKTGDAYS
jgi:hypothetical protein